MNRELICICCPMGCRINVTAEDGVITEVTGNTCPRGKEYAVSELTAPVRMVTSSVKTDGGVCVPVKTAAPVPKEKIMDVMKEIKETRTVLPVKMGDVIIYDVAGTGINIIATRSSDLT